MRRQMISMDDHLHEIKKFQMMHIKQISVCKAIIVAQAIVNAILFLILLNK